MSEINWRELKTFSIHSQIVEKKVPYKVEVPVEKVNLKINYKYVTLN